MEAKPEILLVPPSVERFVAVGMARASSPARRTSRTNLRFVGRRVVPQYWPVEPDRCRRDPPKAPYGPGEIHAFLALATAQPTLSRRMRLAGLICLGGVRAWTEPTCAM